MDGKHEKPEKPEKPLQLKDIEEQINNIKHSCYGMATELIITKDIIFHGAESPTECEKEEISPTPGDRYGVMSEELHKILNSLDNTKGSIRSMRDFFNK